METGLYFPLQVTCAVTGGCHMQQHYHAEKPLLHAVQSSLILHSQCLQHCSLAFIGALSMMSFRGRVIISTNALHQSTHFYKEPGTILCFGKCWFRHSSEQRGTCHVPSRTTESSHRFGWKRLLRSPSPTFKVVQSDLQFMMATKLETPSTRSTALALSAKLKAAHSFSSEIS